MERRTLLPRRFPSPLLLYGVAVVSTLLVLGVRLALDPILGREAPLLLFALAVLVSAWVGGWRSGALATALSAALGGYFFLDPERSFYVEGMTDRVRLVMFLALGALASAFCETLHWQWRRLEGEARERERAHAAERAQRRLLRVTLASIGDGVITTDVEGRVTSLNPVAEALTGWPEADALGQPVKVVFRAIDEGSRQIKESPSMRALKSGQIVGPMTPTVLIARDGTERDVEERASPIRYKTGEVAGTVLVFRDVTQRKAAERDRDRLNEELREQDRRKDEFLAMLAHELRNPLAPLRSAAELLRLRGAAGEEAGQALAVIDRQVAQMVRLIDDLLDISRITRGKIELRKGRVELGAVVEQALEASRPAIEAARHRLSVDLPPRPVRLDADPARLAQVLSNLLNNAAKYTEPGGHIRLSASCEGGEAVIRVADNGIGIAPEQLTRIFDMFAQADHSPSRAQGGLGIGLTLVKRLVEMHGGSVAARSDGPGTGSEFTVRLPLADTAVDLGAQPEPDVPPPAAGRAPAARRVLVVDDNRDAADSLAVLLRMMGSEVRTAYGGPEALEAAAEYRPDLILLDIGLPGMDGYEVARRLRALAEFRGVLLAALTGWGQEEDRRRSREAGFDLHLVKPVSRQTLRNLLAEPALK